jgi:hypothetical protein
MFYVYEPKKAKPKSQRHGEHFYGPYASWKDADTWRNNKGVSTFKIIEVDHLLSGYNVHPDKEI